MIGDVPQLKAFDRGDGVCRHLTDANLCAIYETRPEICNVDRMFARFSNSMTREQYDELMRQSCEGLKALAHGGTPDA